MEGVGGGPVNQARSDAVHQKERLRRQGTRIARITSERRVDGGFGRSRRDHGALAGGEGAIDRGRTGLTGDNPVSARSTDIVDDLTTG